ncbi:Methionyl-tRNA formyltransferase, mitochondrial [Candida viswanathii]|uniref:methionyl-tRNA formyltransferase n=1 Tax=Candida viswanathii TaxID=5486 RepID=A0A367XSP0_9ASCO|nr:Methionyl-tRNA formyltransferase, mitochondrial [Candida viswanathii]
MKLHFPALGQFTLRRSPLWIAFFGSDDFSVASLAKLTQYQSTTTHHTPSPIESIHVITRSIKPTGRNMKAMVDLPIGKYAASQGIPVLRADTATEILDVLSQHQFNLVVAVSYGRLIPAQFIAQCRYGGLNVHPSLLPTYAGSSPLQYALLNDDASTGCTVQTLHPTKFDHGDVLLQSGEIPISGSDNLASLFDKFGEIGGDLLVRTIDQGLFVDPKPVVNDYQVEITGFVGQLSARQIKRVWDALGPVFTFINVNLVRKRKPYWGSKE